MRQVLSNVVLSSAEKQSQGFELVANTYVAWSGKRGFGVYLGENLRQSTFPERKLDQVLGTYSGITSDRGIDPMYNSEVYAIDVKAYALLVSLTLLAQEGSRSEHLHEDNNN